MSVLGGYRLMEFTVLKDGVESVFVTRGTSLVHYLTERGYEIVSMVAENATTALVAVL